MGDQQLFHRDVGTVANTDDGVQQAPDRDTRFGSQHARVRLVADQELARHARTADCSLCEETYFESHLVYAPRFFQRFGSGSLLSRHRSELAHIHTDRYSIEAQYTLDDGLSLVPGQCRVQ